MKRVIVTFEVDETSGEVADQIESGTEIKKIFGDSNNIACAVADGCATIVNVSVE